MGWLVLFPGIAKPVSLAASLSGLWLTEDQRGVIEIASCGAGLCGRIVGMAGFGAGDPAPKDFQGQPECGLEILHGIVPADPGEWDATITNPENGSLYGARLSLDDRGNLRLRGFLRVPLFGSALGSTQLWTGYTGNLTPECRMLP